MVIPPRCHIMVAVAAAPTPPPQPWGGVPTGFTLPPHCFPARKEKRKAWQVAEQNASCFCRWFEKTTEEEGRPGGKRGQALIAVAGSLNSETVWQMPLSLLLASTGLAHEQLAPAMLDHMTHMLFHFDSSGWS